MFLLSPNLELENIRHGFFTRQNGVSEGVHASLNCGPGSGDDPAKVTQNRARVCRILRASALCTAYQCHGAQVAVVEKPWQIKDAPRADALVSKIPGIAIGVLTADCMPILLADSQAKIIGATHAGWKGAFDGVIEATVDAMCRLGASAERIEAALGPAIAQKSYEVGPEFQARFLQQAIENANYFMPSPRGGGHALFDLSGYNRMRLTRAGVSAINPLAEDTCFDENRFFSYRRSCLRQEGAYGRQISAIVLT